MTERKQAKWWRVLLACGLIPAVVYSFSSGPPPGVTGGFGEPTCTDCHVGTVNSGPGSVTITLPASYTPGMSYPVTVSVSDPNQQRWGFELSARTGGGQQAGTLITGADGFTQLTSLTGIQYISHTLSGTRLGTTGGVSFTFQWQAPSVSLGSILFHAAANAANGDFANSGDRIYTTSAVLPEAPASDYLVGDAAPLGSDLNADDDSDDLGEFGNNTLSTTDLILALRAVTNLPGWRPPVCSDRFDAMDSAPADTDTTRGGNGTLSTTDLIITLRRVTGIDGSRPRRAPRGLACP